MLYEVPDFMTALKHGPQYGSKCMLIHFCVIQILSENIHDKFIEAESNAIVNKIHKKHGASIFFSPPEILSISMYQQSAKIFKERRTEIETPESE